MIGTLWESYEHHRFCLIVGVVHIEFNDHPIVLQSMSSPSHYYVSPYSCDEWEQEATTWTQIK